MVLELEWKSWTCQPFCRWQKDHDLGQGEPGEGAGTYEETWLRPVLSKPPAGHPRWSSGWAPTCQSRGCGFDSQSGRIPHAMGQLSPRAATAEARVPWAYAWQQEKAPQWDGCTPQLESSPHSLQLEKARMQQWRPSAAKNKIFFLIIKQTKTKTLPRGQGIYLSETQSAFLHFFNETDECMSWRKVKTILWKLCFSYSHKHIRYMSWYKMGFLPQAELCHETDSWGVLQSRQSKLCDELMSKWRKEYLQLELWQQGCSFRNEAEWKQEVRKACIGRDRRGSCEQNNMVQWSRKRGRDQLK